MVVGRRWRRMRAEQATVSGRLVLCINCAMKRGSGDFLLHSASSMHWNTVVR
ncbi:hypothetical protein BDQ12DRAFT_684154 [Crucibulum laeve]|uniref:Uncharacterized protein n=1 Tax=Crucibulum laeve TaxID=68775 RepID=A0A5C3LZQ7_9AGAR|nr:hypothetical protein BDQ12DRAFT_684154 [Crucibulum laeve]